MKWKIVTFILILLLIGAVLVIRVKVVRNGIVSKENRKIQTSQVELPKYNPNTGSCENMIQPPPKSESHPDFDPNKYSWQVSAPRGIPGKTFKGDVVTLGLRNKYGGDKEYFYFSTRVEQPDGIASTTESVLNSSKWTYSSYPTDFNAGNTDQIGAYTVLYQINGIIVACDGFGVF